MSATFLKTGGGTFRLNFGIKKTKKNPSVTRSLPVQIPVGPHGGKGSGEPDSCHSLHVPARGAAASASLRR